MTTASKSKQLFHLGPMLSIPLADIDPNDAPGEPRHEQDRLKLEVDALVQGMKTSGEPWEPITVIPHPQSTSGFKWQRRGGKRRYLAAKELRWETIPARVLETDDKGADFFALGSNTNRKEHTTYELARAFTHLRNTYGLKTPELIEQMAEYGFPARYSEAYVNNLTSALRQLDPKILAAWATGDERLPTDCLVWLKALPKDKQIDAWADIISGKDWRVLKEHASPTKPATRGPGGFKTARSFGAKDWNTVRPLLLECEGVKPVVKSAAISVFRFVSGESSALYLDGKVVAVRDDSGIHRSTETFQKRTGKAPAFQKRTPPTPPAFQKRTSKPSRQASAFQKRAQPKSSAFQKRRGQARRAVKASKPRKAAKARK